MTKIDRLAELLDSRLFWISFAILTVAVYIFGLDVPLLGPDEPRYAQVAREMFERSDWITPTLGGSNWFEKPALLYWLQIAAYHVLGVSESAARAGSALSGLGTIFSLWIIGNAAAKYEASGGQAEAGNFPVYLGMVAATTFGLIVFSRGATFDIILTFPIAASLAGFFVFDRTPLKKAPVRYAGLAAFYFFAGVALLAKGLVGVLFPFAIVLTYLAIARRRPHRTLLLSLLWGVPLTAMVAAVWYLPMYLTHGWAFVDEFFIQHHFQRYLSNKYRHPQPFYFYFWVLPLMTLPWLPFFVLAIWRSLRELAARMVSSGAGSVDAREANEPNYIRSPLFFFAAAWAAVPLVFFSPSGSKLPGYILPSVPAAAIIAAMSVERFASRSTFRSVAVKLIALATLGAAVLTIQFALPQYARTDSVKGLFMTAAELGYATNRVAGFMTISHNAEFYAAGRSLRNPDGSQRRLNSAAEVAETIEALGGEPLLLIVRDEHLLQVSGNTGLRTTPIAKGGEQNLIAVSLNR